jgi:hypothetical protein
MSPGYYEEGLSRHDVAFNRIFIGNGAKETVQLYRPLKASITGRGLRNLIEKTLILSLSKFNLHGFIRAKKLRQYKQEGDNCVIFFGR